MSVKPNAFRPHTLLGQIKRRQRFFVLLKNAFISLFTHVVNHLILLARGRHESQLFLPFYLSLWQHYSRCIYS